MSVTSVVIALLLVVTACSGAAVPKKDDKKLKHVIITSFGEMPYEPLEGFVQSDVVPVNFQDEEKNPTMDVALRTGILVQDPNEPKDEENSAEENYSSAEARGESNHYRGDRRIKTGEELFREFREKYRYAPKKEPKFAANQWSPVIPSAAEGDFLHPRQPPAPPPREDGFNVDRNYHGDLGEGWNLDDAVEILQDRNYNVLTKTPLHPTLPPRELPPPPLIPPGGRPIYPFPAIPSFPFPEFNPHRRSRLYPFGQNPNFYRQTESSRHPKEQNVNNRQDVLRRQQEGRIQLHPTRIGVPYSSNANVVYGTEYLSGA